MYTIFSPCTGGSCKKSIAQNEMPVLQNCAGQWMLVCQSSFQCWQMVVDKSFFSIDIALFDAIGRETGRLSHQLTLGKFLQHHSVVMGSMHTRWRRRMSMCLEWFKMCGTFHRFRTDCFVHWRRIQLFLCQERWPIGYRRLTWRWLRRCYHIVWTTLSVPNTGSVCWGWLLFPSVVTTTCRYGDCTSPTTETGEFRSHYRCHLSIVFTTSTSSHGSQGNSMKTMKWNFSSVVVSISVVVPCVSLPFLLWQSEKRIGSHVLKGISHFPWRK